MTSKAKKERGPEKCRICACTYERACPGGCGWAEANLCTVCAALREALEDFVENANFASLAGVARLFREVRR